MSEIVNLRQTRKRAARVEREADAAANRAKFGRTKAERQAQAAEAGKIDRTLDGAKRQEPE